MPLVSIVIPVYKAEDLLPRCLDSILAQTMRDWECVMVDDGSPDGSGAVCDRYAAQDSRFKVIHKVNEGGSIARNVGVENACGKWLYFVDNDDVLAPGLLEAALKQQETSLDSMVLWNWCDRADQLPRTLPEALPVQHCTAKDVGKLYMDARLYYVWNKLFRMDLVKQNGIAHKKDMDYGDDMIFCLDYIKAWFREKPNADFAVIQLPLYCYSVDNVNSMTRRYLPSYCGDELRLCDYLLDFFGRDFPIEDKTDRRRVLTHCLHTMGWAIGLEANRPANGEASHAEQYLADLRMTRLLNVCRNEKVYIPYAGPLRKCSAAGCRKLYLLEQQNPRQYQRRYWLGYWLHTLATGQKAPVQL